MLNPMGHAKQAVIEAEERGLDCDDKAVWAHCLTDEDLQ